MSDSLATPWTGACQVPSMEFSKQEHWSEYPFLSPWDLPSPGIKPVSPALAGRFFTTEPLGSPKVKTKNRPTSRASFVDFTHIKYALLTSLSRVSGFLGVTDSILRAALTSVESSQLGFQRSLPCHPCISLSLPSLTLTLRSNYTPAYLERIFWLLWDIGHIFQNEAKIWELSETRHWCMHLIWTD